MTQTAIQLLRESIDSEMKSGTKMVVNWDMYLEMEKEQIIKAYTNGSPEFFDMAEEYYNETYGVGNR
jgi:hypothetical protein